MFVVSWQAVVAPVVLYGCAEFLLNEHYWRVFSEISVGSTFNMIKRVIVCCEWYAIVFCDRFYDWLMRWFVVFVMFCFGRVFDWEIVWVVCCGCFLIDFTIDCRDSLSCLFWRFVFWLFLIEWLRGLFFLIVWFDWLFRLVVFYWTVVILWERRKIKVWRCVAMLPLLNTVSKWVRSDSSGWSFDLGVYCLLWKRFLVLNVVLWAAQVKSFAK